MVKNLPANSGDAGDSGSNLGSGNLLEKGMVSHSSILPRIIPWTEEPGGLRSMGSQRSLTQLFFFFSDTAYSLNSNNNGISCKPLNLSEFQSPH